jgi:hypothetical protein
VEPKLAGAAMDSRSKVKSEASRFFFVADVFAVTKFSFVTRFFFAEKLFIVARFFFVTSKIGPHSDSMCAELPLEAGVFFVCSEVWKGCPNADAEWDLALRATTGGKVRMRSVKNRLESC